jgi:hypothetical protein
MVVVPRDHLIDVEGGDCIHPNAILREQAAQAPASSPMR